MNGCQSFDAPRDFSGASTLRRRIASFFFENYLLGHLNRISNMHVDAALPAFTDPLQTLSISTSPLQAHIKGLGV
jgi:hypothetical protein